MSKPTIYHINQIISDSNTIKLDTSGSITIAVGNTNSRPGVPTIGDIRFNTDILGFEGYDGTGWLKLGSQVNDYTNEATIVPELMLNDSQSNSLIFKTSNLIRMIISDIGNIYLNPVDFDQTGNPESAVLYIGSNGNIGVNTLNATHNITVNGSIKSTNIVGEINGGNLNNDETKIIHKHTTDLNVIPDVTHLNVGELVINSATGKVYVKKYNEFYDEESESIIVDEEIKELLNEDNLKKWIVVLDDYTAMPNDMILADTEITSFNILLPANPIIGTEIIIADPRDWNINPVIVNGNSNSIKYMLNELILNESNKKYVFIYTGETWQVYE